MTVFSERVIETTTTTGTGTYSLAGAPGGARTFVAAFGTGVSVPYRVQNADNTIWEERYGEITDASPDTLTRGTLIRSSTGSTISWGAGTKYVYNLPQASILDSALKGNIGSTRPEWLEAGGSWIDNSGTPWLLNLYDGTNDCVIGAVESGVFDAYANGASLRRSSFSAHKNATDQTGIATGTATKVTFPTEGWDIGDIYDAANSKILPPFPCKMRVSFQAIVNAGIVDQARIIGYLYKNGAQAARNAGTISGTPTVVSASASALIDFNGTTDYVEAYVIVEGAGDKTISGEAIGTYLCGEVI